MSNDRFTRFAKRARTCYRAAAHVDHARFALQSAAAAVVGELDGDTKSPALQLALESVRTAENALHDARDRLKAALEEQKLTPENREVGFWKAG